MHCLAKKDRVGRPRVIPKPDETLHVVTDFRTGCQQSFCDNNAVRILCPDAVGKEGFSGCLRTLDFGLLFRPSFVGAELSHPH